MRKTKRILASVLAAACALTSVSVTAFAGSAQNADLTYGMIGKYTFAESSNSSYANSVVGKNAAGDAKFGMDGTAGYWGSAGLVGSSNGKALTSNNHKTKIPVSALADVSDVTIQMYVKVNKANDWNRLWSIAPDKWEDNADAQNRSLSITKRDENGRHIGFNYQTDRTGDTSTGAAKYLSAGDFDTELVGSYHLVTFVQSGTTGTLYIDNNAVASGDVGVRTVGKIVKGCPADHPAILALGYAPEWNDVGMNTDFDDVKIYGRALTPEEVAENATKFAAGNGSQVTDPSLIYDFDFNETTDGRTFANKVAGNPDAVVFPNDIKKTAGTLGDGAVSFNSRDSQSHPHMYAKANALKTVNDQTFTMWVKPSSIDRQFLFTSGPLANVKGNGDNGNNRDNYALGIIVDNRIKWEVKVQGQGRSCESAKLVWDYDTYYQITFVKEGNWGKIYLNNALIAQSSGFNVDLSQFVYDKYNNPVDYTIDIGGNSLWSDGRNVEEGLVGELDEFRVYDRALSVGEADILYRINANKAGMTLYDSLNDEGTGVIRAFNTASEFNGFRDWNSDPRGDGQWRGKAMADASVMAIRCGGSDHFLWGPRLSTGEQESIVTGNKYYVKTLVKVTNSDKVARKYGADNDVFEFNTVAGTVYGTFDQATLDANPNKYGNALLEEGKWVPLVWSFDASDTTNRNVEWSMLNLWSSIADDTHNSGEFALQIGAKIVVSSDAAPLTAPEKSLSPYFYNYKTNITSWNNGEDVNYAWDLTRTGGGGRRIHKLDGSTVARESNHIYYSMRLPEDKRTLDETGETKYYFKVLLKADRLDKIPADHWALEWDWDGSPTTVKQTMPSELVEGRYVALVYEVTNPKALNDGGEGRFRIHGSPDWNLTTGKYLVLSTNDTPLSAEYGLDDNTKLDSVTIGDVVATVDEAAKTVKATVAKGTDLTNVTVNAVAQTGTAVVATDKSKITVTAGNGVDTQDYALTIDFAKSTTAKLGSVKVDNINATINEETKAVTVTVPYGTNVANAVVTATAEDDGTVVVATDKAKITVTAEDGVTVIDYTLTITPAGKTPVASVTLSASKATLSVGDAKQLTATVLPGNATDKAVTWSTSNKNVATVSGGKVTAIGAGVAKITAKADGKTATFTVTVNPAKVTKLTAKVSGKKLTVSFAKGKGAKYTKLVIYKNGKVFKTISKTTAKSYAIKGLKKGSYQVKALAFSVVSGKTYSSSYTAKTKAVKVK